MLSQTDHQSLSIYNQLIRGTIQDIQSFLKIANKEILELNCITSKNWDLVENWIAELISGKEIGKTSMESPSDTLKFKVKSIELIKHLVVGFEWFTPMYDREEDLT